MSTLYGVLSGFKQPDRRRAVIDTWANDLLPDDDLVFIVGDAASKQTVRAGNLLIVPCSDEYHYLPDKVFRFIEWAVANSPASHVFKCDDDTYVRPERMDSLPDVPFVGHLMTSDDVVYGSGGAGYRVSIETASELAILLSRAILQKPSFASVEDMMVGYSLGSDNIPLLHSDLLHPWDNRVPEPDNDLVSGHYCKPERMAEIHCKFARTD